MNIKKIFFACFLFLTSMMIIPAVCFAENSSLVIDLHGVTPEMSDNVLLRLKENDENIEEWYKHSHDVIRQGMEPYGYFKPSIRSSLKLINGKWCASFTIKKGAPVVVREMQVGIQGIGKNNDALSTQLALSPIKIGEIFKTVEYEKYKDTLLNTAIEQGYLKAHWQYHVVTIDLHHQTAKIKLVLTTGDRYYFGKFDFTQTELIYSPAFLNRFLLSAPTGYFSILKLTNYQKQLSESNQFFKTVMVTPDTTAGNHLIPTTIALTPSPAKKYTLGVGYSTWSGPRALANINFQHLNDKGHSFESTVKVSPVISELSAKYFIPGFNSLTERWILGANVSRFLPKNGQSNSMTLLAAYNLKREDWETNVSLNYLLEKYKVTLLPQETSKLFYLGLDIAYKKTDDPIFPAHGFMANFMMRQTPIKVFSSTRFFQSEFGMKYIFPLFTDNTRLITRGDIGYTIVHDLNILPMSMRFFTGGANSIRGYKESSIGPGKYLVDASLELQQRVHGDWYIALFADQGKATDHFDTPWNKSVGLGILYASLLGPVKVYVAKDISLPNKPNRIEFSFGPEF